MIAPRPAFTFPRTCFSLLLFLVIICTASTLSDIDRRSGPVTLTTDAQWLLAHLREVVVVDAREPLSYRLGHIPGAANTPWKKFVQLNGKPGDRNWGVLLEPEALAAKIGAVGIDGRKPVVVYADPPGWGEDGRIAWMLKVAGIGEVRILDGGFRAWRAAGGKTSWFPAAPQPVDFRILHWNSQLLATTDWIVAHRDRVRLVDARSPEEFRGAIRFGEKRGGHLPGAVLVPFDSLFRTDGKLKTPHDLKHLFAAAGLKPENNIVAYCTGGIRSAYMTLVLRAVGFTRVRNYDASFYEWAGVDHLPVERPGDRG